MSVPYDAAEWARQEASDRAVLALSADQCDGVDPATQAAATAAGAAALRGMADILDRMGATASSRALAMPVLVDAAQLAAKRRAPCA